MKLFRQMNNMGNNDSSFLYGSCLLYTSIEASLRRLSHYDYWDDAVRRSILMDSQADLLMYGMGENTIVEVADALASGLAAKDLCYIRGTCWKTKSLEYLSDYILSLIHIL